MFFEVADFDESILTCLKARRERYSEGSKRFERRVISLGVRLDSVDKHIVGDRVLYVELCMYPFASKHT